MADLLLMGCCPEDRVRTDLLQQAIEARGWLVDSLSLVQSKRDWLDDSRPRIMAAPCVIAVWTAASVKDQWTALGADLALERRTLVSVVLDPVALPRAFRGIESVEIVGWSGTPESAAMDDLAGSLTVMLGPPPRRQAAVPIPLRPASTAPASHPANRSTPPILVYPPTSSAGGVPIASEDPGPERRVGVLPCIYGWAIAWAIGVTTMGLYLLSGPHGADASQVAIANPLYSAVTGATVGLIGAGFMIFALVRKRVRLSSSQLGFIVFGWGFGGGCGLLAVADLGLPVVGRLYGVLGFDWGWVVCWMIAGALGSAFTWYALRRSNGFLDRRDLAWIAGGFALGALGGWLASWLVVSFPILVLDWVLAKFDATGATDAVSHLMVQALSLGLIGAGGGAAFGLGGGLVILGALSRGDWLRAD